MGESKKTWGWLGYHRMGWVNEDGRKLYEARMCAWEGQISVEVSALFWAKHPVKMLRKACAEQRTEAELIAYLQKDLVTINKVS